MPIIAGMTQIEKYKHLGQELYLKREDQNPSGSFKDRLIAHIWDELINLEESEIVLSSSGNLAISLLYYQANSAKKLQNKSGTTKKIKIFLKENLPEIKMRNLKALAGNADVELVFSKRPKSECFRYAKQKHVFWLRNSTGDDYPKAYEPMAREINQFEIDNGVQFDSLFVCCSSGTASQGLLQGFFQIKKEKPVYIAQTTRVHPLAKEYDTEFENQKKTAANAIADKVMPRRDELRELINKVHGGGFVISNEEIAYARNLLREWLGYDCSGNAALSLAAFFKSEQKSYNLKMPIIIISGN
jgi:threonine dehydratase